MKNSIQLAKTAFSFLILTGLFALPAKASNSCQKVLSNRTVLMDQARLEVNGFERINSVTIPMDVSKKILERLLLLGDVGHFTMNRSGEIDILRVLKHHKDFVTHYEEVKKFLSDYAQPIFIKLVSDLTEHLNQRVPDQKYSFVLLELRWQGPDGRIYKDLFPSNPEVFTFHFDGGP